MISSRNHVNIPPRLFEPILLEMVYNLMIFGWHQASAIVFTTPLRFTPVCCWGLAATLILCYPMIIRIHDHFPRMMFGPFPSHGFTYIPRRKPTVPDALCVPPLPTYLTLFLVMLSSLIPPCKEKASKTATPASRSLSTSRPDNLLYRRHQQRHYCIWRW